MAHCTVCQKARLVMTSGVEPIVRHIKPLHHRSAGIDTLTITPVYLLIKQRVVALPSDDGRRQGGHFARRDHDAATHGV